MYSSVHIYIYIRTCVKVISSPALRELRPPKNALNSAIGASTVWVWQNVRESLVWVCFHINKSVLMGLFSIKYISFDIRA